ncbi:MAG: hypothetical protein FWH11_09210 [Micrococcales bacterium]|nr:hypothetical protein [Micrococcales bacterium]
MNSSSSRPFLAASAGLCLALSSLLGACSSSGGLGARSTDGLGATVLNSVKEKHKHSSSSCPSSYVCWSYSYGGSSNPHPDPDPIPQSYELKQDIPLGTCYDTYSKRFDLSDAEVVDCDTQHVLEVVSTFTWTAAPEGQDDEMVLDQVDSCWGEVRPRLRMDEIVDQTNVDVWYPSAAQIRSGSSTGYCMLRPEDTGFLVGSLVDDTYRGTLPAGQVEHDVGLESCVVGSWQADSDALEAMGLDTSAFDGLGDDLNFDFVLTFVKGGSLDWTMTFSSHGTMHGSSFTMDGNIALLGTWETFGSDKMDLTMDDANGTVTVRVAGQTQTENMNGDELGMSDIDDTRMTVACSASAMTMIDNASGTISLTRK